MRKNPPRTKMEPTAPKVQSRYLSGPSVSCHDHCKCATKEPIETKPTHSFLRRIPKAPPDRTKLEASTSVNRIKKAPSITTRNVNNNTIVKDPISKKDGITLSTKKGVAIEPKSRDLKPKSENSQAKRYNPPHSRTSTRRHSDMFLPDENMPLPSSRVPKRRLSEIGIPPKKDVVSVSNTSLVRGSRTNKNEPKKDLKLLSANKKPNSINRTVSSPKRGAKVPTLRSYKSLPQSDLKSSRKSKPMKPIEEVVPENTLQVVESNNGVENTKTESHITPESSPRSDEKDTTNGHNRPEECSPPMEDDTTVTNCQHNENVADSEVVDTKEATKVVESSTNNESDITPNSPNSCTSSEDNITNIGLQECSPSMEDDTNEGDDQHNEKFADSEEVIDTKEALRAGKLAVETTDCSIDVDELAFRRGKFLSPRSEGSSPRKLQFMDGKELDENETEKPEKIILRRMSFDGVIHRPESQSHSVSVDLKHQEIAEKEMPSLFNKVIEETTSKLIQTRKSKVKALVGAFENIVSTSTQMS